MSARAPPEAAGSFRKPVGVSCSLSRKCVHKGLSVKSNALTPHISYDPTPLPSEQEFMFRLI